MNIIFPSAEDLDTLGKNYIVLELDTVQYKKDEPARTAYCVIGTESLTVNELPVVSQFVELHANLMKNYRLKNWKFCEDALEHLQGRWRGTLDSFYLDLGQRINQYKSQPVPADWTGVVVKTA